MNLSIPAIPNRLRLVERAPGFLRWAEKRDLQWRDILPGTSWAWFVEDDPSWRIATRQDRAYYRCRHSIVNPCFHRPVVLLVRERSDGVRVPWGYCSRHLNNHRWENKRLISLRLVWWTS